MKVKELIEALLLLDGESEVIIQKRCDDYSPLNSIDDRAIYFPENSWSGEVYYIDWSAEDNGLDEEKWDEIKNGPRCCILFPVN